MEEQFNFSNGTDLLMSMPLSSKAESFCSIYGDGRRQAGKQILAGITNGYSSPLDSPKTENIFTGSHYSWEVKRGLEKKNLNQIRN